MEITVTMTSKMEDPRVSTMLSRRQNISIPCFLKCAHFVWLFVHNETSGIHASIHVSFGSMKIKQKGISHKTALLCITII